jgi:uncharacterized protein (TIRG00374 family)
MMRAVALAAISLGLGLLGVYVVGREALLDGASYRVTNGDAAVGALALLSFVGLWLLPSVRVQQLSARHGYRVGPWRAGLAHVAMVFGAALTPSGTGGAPTLVAALGRFGVPWGTAIGIAVQIFILDLVVFATLVPLALAYVLARGDIALPLPIQVLSFAAAVVATAGAVALGRYPRLGVRFMLALARRPLLRRWSARLHHHARTYYRSAQTFGAMRFGGWLWLQVLSASGWLASFTLYWALLSLYGAEVGYLALTTVLSAITLISFVVPTPGASGFMEVAAGLAAATQGAVAATAPLALWRLGSFYVTYAIGPVAGWWLFRTTRPTMRRRPPPSR